MKLPQTGGCQCGRLRYEIAHSPYMIYTCHCANCQRFTSSAFSIGMIVDEQVFHLTGIEPRAMLHTADSGRNLTRWVCPECGSWICSGAKPGSPNPNTFRAVRAGTLDDISWLRPTGHFWTRSKQPGSCCPMNEVTSSERSRTTCSHSSTRWWPMRAERLPDRTTGKNASTGPARTSDVLIEWPPRPLSARFGEAGAS
jgi:hypothetical protein